MATRIAIVADIHHGAPSHTKRGDAALALLSEFKSFSNSVDPDLVLDLGDRISDENHDRDIELQNDVATVFSGVEAPVHHICGNHDRHHLSVSENEDVLGQELASKRIDIGGWRILVWRADSKIHSTPEFRGFRLVEADLLWLASELAKADRPVLIATHVPFSGHGQIGNYYFHQNPDFSTYPEAARIRAVIGQCRQPVVCLAGHVHWNTATQVDGIMHLTQQSLTESFTTQGEPAKAWGLLELGDQVLWQVHGDDPLEVRFTPQTHRWTPCLGPFS